MYQTVFQRYEQKYLITTEQYAALRDRFGEKLAPDRYGEYPLFNVYYDTGAYDLARFCAGKPLYKEKLRLRSYGKVLSGAPAFLELKKKYRGVVYKRRVRLFGAIGVDGANALEAGGDGTGTDALVLREIRHFMSRWPGLSPRIFLAYDRSAWTGIDDEGLRLTFDVNIRFRKTDLRLDREGWDREILAPGQILLEVKTPGAIPVWLCRALSDCGIFPRSFSKYGACYSRYLFQWGECTSA